MDTQVAARACSRPRRAALQVAIGQLQLLRITGTTQGGLPPWIAVRLRRAVRPTAHRACSACFDLYPQERPRRVTTAKLRSPTYGGRIANPKLAPNKKAARMSELMKARRAVAMLGPMRLQKLPRTGRSMPPRMRSAKTARSSRECRAGDSDL
jgi:hypothetical protein